MSKALEYYGLVRQLPNGELLVDTDSLRRPSARRAPSVSGDDDGDDEDDDLSGDDDEDDDGDDLSGDYVDDLEGDYVDDLGGPRRKRRRRARKTTRQNKRAIRRGGASAPAPRPAARAGAPVKDNRWGKTVVAGKFVAAAAESGTITIRPQHEFKAEDVTFEGSLAGSLVTSIQFADRNVWSDSDGIDVAVFGVSGFLRDLLRGQEMVKGLDILINVTTPGAGTVRATITGYKPYVSK